MSLLIQTPSAIFSYRSYNTILRRCVVICTLVLLVYLLCSNIDKTITRTQNIVINEPSHKESASEWKHDQSFDIKELAPCGEVCTYGGRFVRKGVAYPQLHKPINCENIMKRMAYRDHAVIYPPPEHPPQYLVDEFTMGGAMPIREQWYLNENWTDTPRRYEKEWILTIMDKLKTGQNVNMYEDGICVQDTLKKYKDELRGQWGVVIGTELPWLESILLGYGARNVTTLEYAPLIFEYPQLESYTPYDFAERYLRGEARQFDFGASFSSIEHSGLGRYTDPLNPYGDLEAMAQAWCMIKPGGMFAVGVPYDKNNSDYIAWNAHRMYGTRRLKHLTANWEVLEQSQCADIFNHKFLILRKSLE